MPKSMPELNTCRDLQVVSEEDYDTMTIIDLGDSIALSQVAEDGQLHNVLIGLKQAEALLGHIRRIIE